MAINGFSRFPNVTVSNLFYPKEPSIIINPKSPNILVAGANLESFYYSLDYGQTWPAGKYVEGLNLADKTLSPGAYVYKLMTDEKVISRKMVVE
jgi:hypothetical protein